MKKQNSQPMHIEALFDFITGDNPADDVNAAWDLYLEFVSNDVDFEFFYNNAPTEKIRADAKKILDHETGVLFSGNIKCPRCEDNLQRIEDNLVCEDCDHVFGE